MKHLMQRFIREDEGQDIIEYALLAAFISICAVVILGQIAPNIQSRYTQVSQAID